MNLFKHFLLVILLCTISSAKAQIWTQMGEDLNGEATLDYFGYKVSVNYDGSVIAVSGYQNDGSGTDAGHVRVFQNDNGTWTQIGDDIDGEVAQDHSGRALSISADGSIVAIGSMYNNDNGNNAGQVRIFKNNTGTWSQIGEDIDGETAEDFFGYSLSLSADGSIIAIGGVNSSSSSGNGTSSGHVRVFQNNAGVWEQIGDNINGEAAGDFSGYAVSLNSDGTIVAIGAYKNSGNGTNSGHVRIFENNAGTWTQIGDDIDGEAENNYSGCAVSISSDGTIVAIGAYSNSDAYNNAGHVRIFQNNSGAWTQIGEDIDGEAAEDLSGTAVSLSADGSIVAIGARANDGNGSDSGHVRIFKNITGTWTQIGNDIDGEAADDLSGTSVSLNANGLILVIGAPGNDGNGTASGHVRVYGHESLGIDDLSINNFSIYPNPTSRYLFFEFKLLVNSDVEIAIYNSLGKLVLLSKEKSNKNIFTVDLSNFPSGSYTYKIVRSEFNKTGKVMIIN